jgi:hypothetical protein
MNYVVDPLVWLCLGLGLAWPIGFMLVILGLNLDRRKPSIFTQLIFCVAAGSSMYGLVVLNQDYLTDTCYSVSLYGGLIVGFLGAIALYIRTRFYGKPIKFYTVMIGDTETDAGNQQYRQNPINSSLLTKAIVRVTIAWSPLPP